MLKVITIFFILADKTNTNIEIVVEVKDKYEKMVSNYIGNYNCIYNS